MRFQYLRKKTFLKDSLWSLGGNFLGKGLSLLAGILVAKHLGRDIYGEYSFLKNTIISFAIFSTLGLGYTSTTYVARYLKESPNKIKGLIRFTNLTILVLCGFIGLVLFFFSETFLQETLNSLSFSSYMGVLTILILLNGITVNQVGILSGFGFFKEIAFVNIVVGIVSFISTLYLTFNFGLNGALLSLFIVQIVNSFINYFLIHSKVKRFYNKDTEGFSKKDLQGVLSFTFPIALQEGTFALTSWVTTFLLVRYGTLGDLGLYNGAGQWCAVILFVPGVLRNVILKYFSDNISENIEHEKILNQTVLINVISTVLPIIGLLVFIEPISNFYGDSFSGIKPLIIISCITTVFTSVGNVYAQAYMSKGKNWYYFLLSLTRDIISIIVFFILISFFEEETAMNLTLSRLFSFIIFVTLIVFFYKENKTK